jgi:hypothetical protein
MSQPKKDGGAAIVRARRAVDALRAGEVLDRERVEAIADGINNLIGAVEAGWSTKFPFAGNIRLWDYDGELGKVEVFLWYRRHSEGWRLLVDEDQFDGSSKTLFLTAVPIEDRLKAVAKLPDLEKQLIRDQKSRSAAVVSTFDQLLELARSAAQPSEGTKP